MPDKLLIGLYDVGVEAGGASAPSLDIAKYSSYHKARGDIVRNLRDLKDSSEYDIIYVHSKSRETQRVNIIKPNVKFVERAPRLNTFLPLSPMVEAAPPDWTYYASWSDASRFGGPYVTAVLRSIFGLFYTTRLTMYGKEVNHPPLPEGEDKRDLLLYDVGVADSEVFFDIMKEYGPKRIAFVYRQFVSDPGRLQRLLDMPKHHKTTLHNYVYNNGLTFDEFKENPELFCTKNHVDIALPPAASIDDIVRLWREYLNIAYYARSIGLDIYFFRPKVDITCIDSFSLNTLWDYLSIAPRKGNHYYNAFDFYRFKGSPRIQQYLYNETDLTLIFKLLEPILRCPVPKPGDHYTPIWEYGL